MSDVGAGDAGRYIAVAAFRKKHLPYALIVIYSRLAVWAENSDEEVTYGLDMSPRNEDQL
jgi:hypothetical protein